MARTGSDDSWLCVSSEKKSISKENERVERDFMMIETDPTWLDPCQASKHKLSQVMSSECMDFKLIVLFA